MNIYILPQILISKNLIYKYKIYLDLERLSFCLSGDLLRERDFPRELLLSERERLRLRLYERLRSLSRLLDLLRDLERERLRSLLLLRDLQIMSLIKLFQN